MSTILVSGGAGFVGSHLCRKLLTQGHTVLCLDNLYTGSADNISDLNESSRFVFSVHDVTVPYPAKKIDYIFNLACPASPVHYQAQPVTTFKTAVIGTINMLELARQCGARLLQASTSEIYGDPLVHPQPETYWGNVNPIGIRSCYDEGKRAGETLCADYERQFGTEVRIARIFNTYGPSMNRNDGRVVSNFIIQALEKKPLTIYGDGSQTRSFCYVDDLVEGLIRLMNHPENPGPVNLGNSGEFTVRELAELILSKTGSPSEIISMPLPGDDPKVRQPDLSRAKKFLDWSPQIPLSEGLDRTILYFKSLMC